MQPYRPFVPRLAAIGLCRLGAVTQTDRPRGEHDAGAASLDQAQVDGLVDMDPEAFRSAAHAVVDRMADYLAGVERYAVLPPIEPGSLRGLFPGAAPDAPEPLAAILADYDALIEPNATHWQHPGFFAYFGSTALGARDPRRDARRRPEPEPDAVADLADRDRARGRRGRMAPPGGRPAGVIRWPPDRYGLDVVVDRPRGGARGGGARRGGPRSRGPDGRRPAAGLRLERGALVDREGVHDPGHRPGRLRPDPDERALRDADGLLAAAIADDRAVGRTPVAVVATIGTTGSTSVDPVAAIADLAEREGIWLHVDAAYAGAIALDPASRGPFAGWERADSVLVNPHKWLYTPFDASLLLTRRMDHLRAAFSSVPEYLRTLDRATTARDYNEYQPQLGRRFRALKLWLILRYFGVEGLRRRVVHQVTLGRGFAELGRRRAGLGAPGAGPVLDGLFPLATTPGRRARGRAGRPNDARRAERARSSTR